jgi:hypothetical protein
MPLHAVRFKLIALFGNQVTGQAGAPSSPCARNRKKTREQLEAMLRHLIASMQIGG